MDSIGYFMAYNYTAITIILCIFVYWAMRSGHWPFKKFGWRQRIITWTITITAIGCAYLAGQESWNDWNLPTWLRWWVGFPICFIISSFSSAAFFQMGLDQGMGANHKLTTSGLFKWSRNPTYLSNIMLCLGYILLAASTPALLSCLALSALYFIAVPYEENWLEQNYGSAYKKYKSNVPRWL